MRKKILTGILVSVLSLGVLTGCGSSADDSTTAATEDKQTTQEASESGDDANVESKGTITVAASATPHAEILAAAKPILAKEGWDLEVTEYDDYVLPNEVVEGGEIDILTASTRKREHI